MKAMVFTLDAIFALSIAVVSVLILLYFSYYTQAPYTVLYSNAQSVLSTLLSTPFESIQNSSILAKAMANQYAGANATWPQFMGGPSRNDSNDFGPIKPIISSVFAAGSTITTGVVADYGNIYFAAGNTVYAVNATTNNAVWSRSGATVVSNLALYSGMLIFANSTNMTEISAKTGATVVGKPATLPSSPLLVYDNKIYFCGAASTLNVWYANNLSSTGWTVSLAATPVGIAVADGNMAVKMAANAISFVVVPVSPAGQQLWSITPASLTSNLATKGPTIYFGGSSMANALIINSSQASGFPVSTTAITGVATYPGYVIYQSTNGVVALSPSGASIWSATAPSYFGTSITNATPALSRSMVYTLWSNGLAGQYLSNGTVAWFSKIPPTAGVLPYMALAYGRLYVVAGNKVLAYGACNAPSHESALSAIATMYLNSDPGCGEALSSALFPSANYTVSLGNVIPGNVMAASFSGSSSYITARNSQALNTSFTSVSFWLKINSLPSSGVGLVNYGGNGNCPSITYCGWLFYLTPNGIVQFSAMSASSATTASSGYALNTKTWYFIAGTYNGSAASLYVNGGAPYVTAFAGSITPPPPSVNLTIGTGLRTATTYLNGNIADLQVYGTNLTTLKINQLYLRGIQGAPLQSPSAVAWYPLGGDTNDYALFNPGYNNGVSFIYQNYTLPSLANAYSISQSSVPLPLFNYSTGSESVIKAGVYTWR
jgi:hypothetical protein